ncbi:unnamed protein product [Cuscuta epithymum]|uniref:Uncharacterized protein n=1 Tax=Cuscuta epithymum TaxID=186058 RepID=A0AAV0C3T3_9ASTE|nr:unnamed protein product [Cuscuta epithymum]
MELVFVRLPYSWSYVWTAKRCTLGTQQTPVKNSVFVLPKSREYWSPGFAGDVRHPNYEKKQVYPRQDSLSLFVPSRELLVFWLRIRRSSSVHKGEEPVHPVRVPVSSFVPVVILLTFFPRRRRSVIHRSQGGTGYPIAGSVLRRPMLVALLAFCFCRRCSSIHGKWEELVYLAEVPFGSSTPPPHVPTGLRVRRRSSYAAKEDLAYLVKTPSLIGSRLPFSPSFFFVGGKYVHRF